MEQRMWAKRITYDLTRLVTRLLGVVTCGIRCEGRQHVPTTGGALICSTHQSYLDPILMGLSCDRRLSYLARRSLFRFRAFKWLIQWYDAIPIERDGMGISGFRETLRRLRRGEMVVVFPEGTRTRDGTIGPLQPGFTVLARRGKVPLVPVAIVGAYRAWPRSQIVPRPAPIWIQYGRPISTDEIKAMSDEQLLERLSQDLQRCYEASRYPTCSPRFRGDSELAEADRF